MSLMKRFQERKLKDPSYGTGAKVLGTMPSAAISKQQTLTKLEKEMAKDLASLKLIKSVKQKESVKTQDLVPKYMPTVKSLKAAGSGHAILGQILVWLFDIKDIPEAMDLAVYCIEHEVPMPERFKRDLPTYLCDTIVDWADAEQDAGRSAEPYFGQVCDLAVDWDIPDQVRAKISRLQGLIAMDKEDFAAAVAALKTAAAYGAKVKTVLAQAEKKLEAGTEE